MNLEFDISLAEKQSKPQHKVRVMSEDWVARNMYCPICGATRLNQCKANSSVKDFVCPQCESVYELKAHKKITEKPQKKITGAGYYKMLERIKDLDNPHFLFLFYANNKVRNVIFIPNYLITEDIIEERPELPDVAKRKGWKGCKIKLMDIAEEDMIYIIRKSEERDRNSVLDTYHSNLKRKGHNTSNSWLRDVLYCVNKMEGETFSPNILYSSCGKLLRYRHPENKNIDAKIRQVLKELQKRGTLPCISKGHYKKM